MMAVMENSKRYLPLTIGLLGLAVLLGAGSWFIFYSNDEAEVRQVVTEFGTRLKNVPLTGEGAVVAQSIDTEYVSYATPELIEIWKADPLEAPGRLTSSPWPERIEIVEIQKLGGAYLAVADVILVSSVEGEELRERVFLVVEERNGDWRISDYTKQVSN